MEQIINSILDNDLYKLTMQMAVVKKFPYAKVQYGFINRGKTSFPEGFAEELRKQIKYMEKLKLTKLEKKFLEKRCYYLDPTYLDFLSGYRYDSTEVGVIQKGGVLEISIAGYWHRTILWEVPLMALISELYFKMTNQVPWDEIKRTKNNNEKKQLFLINGLHYADFATRRRNSYMVHDEVVGNFADKFNKNFVGTSNVHLAHKYNVNPIGTHAHEWFMFHAAKYGYKMANHLAMENWTDIFRGDLGIALPDTFTSDSFFKTSFDKKFSKLYDGVRHDSGDALEFTDKVIAHYDKMGIDPKTKVIVFSDSLNPQRAVEIKEYCRGKIMCSFGIGTNFSNDVGLIPLNMVIKIIEAKPEGEEWHHCIKLSDSEGKHTGVKKEIEIAKYVLNIN